MPTEGKGVTPTLLQQMAYGFWVRSKQTRRAVRWEPQRHKDGRQSFRGRGWVEVLEHGATRAPEKFHAADVELVGPHQWLDYYPGVDEPVCGWAKEPGRNEFCPRQRHEGEPFCRRHMAELNDSAGEETHGESERSHTS